MSANFSFTNKRPRQLERPTEPDEIIKPEEVRDSQRLAQILQRIAKKVTELGRRWAPSRTDFEEIECAGDPVTPETVRLDHLFGGPVRWWVVNARGTNITDAPHIRESEDANGNPLSTKNTLVLDVYFTATLAIRVEEAGS